MPQNVVKVHHYITTYYLSTLGLEEVSYDRLPCLVSRSRNGAFHRRWVVKCCTQSFITCKVFHLPRENRDGRRTAWEREPPKLA